MSNYDFVPERIALTVVGNVTVSTVETFSGFSESRIAETMIFLDGGEMPTGLNDQDGERCGVGGGKEQHDKWVAKVRDAQAAMAQSTAPATMKIRHYNDTRRHVPLIAGIHGQWVASVRDHHNQLHFKCTFVWAEALDFATAWAHVNAVHNLPVDASHELAA